MAGVYFNFYRLVCKLADPINIVSLKPQDTGSTLVLANRELHTDNTAGPTVNYKRTIASLGDR